MKNLQDLKDAIIKAVPEIREYAERCMDCGYGFEYCRCIPKQTEWFRDRPITLEDVIHATFERYKGPHEVGEGNYLEMTQDERVATYETLRMWKLHAPLEDQSEELINFLHSILCK